MSPRRKITLYSLGYRITGHDSMNSPLSKMSKKYFVIKSCLYFVVISVMLVLCFFWPWLNISYGYKQPILKVWNAMEQSPEEMLLDTSTIYEFNSPSVESFIQASTTDNSLKGLAVYLSLTDACQTLDDVSKAKNQVHKIALVTLVQNDQTTCTKQDLAKNVQNAGYSMLIYCCATATSRVKNSENKVMIMIPVATVYYTNVSDEVKRIFSDADRTDVDIVCSPTHGQQIDYLRKMESYLKRLYFWFLIGPLITLEWMRRTRKFCWMFDSQEEQLVGEERASENGGNAAENEIRTMEEGENGTEEPLASNYQESRGRNPGREVLSQSSEEQPLLVEFTRLPRHNRSVVTSFKKFFCKGVMCFSYLMLFIAALPISISCGSFSFFRFDHRVFPAMFFITLDRLRDRVTLQTFLSIVLLLWSPLQIFCFLLYSRLACTTTWVIPINVLRLIRSDWFASNISLLVLAVVVPLCASLGTFSFFATYNTVCTVCNMLFIFILNKHNFVTRYVFYISVCMIFAYLESSIVAVFYFVLNSEGSLDNLKLTALRTVAIGLTLKVSFSSSMHIVWKLNKPTESLFEGLSEK